MIRLLGGRCARCGGDGSGAVGRWDPRKLCVCAAEHGRGRAAHFIISGSGWLDRIGELTVMCRACVTRRMVQFRRTRVEHGTLPGYYAGCRCMRCSRANTIRHAVCFAKSPDVVVSAVAALGSVYSRRQGRPEIRIAAAKLAARVESARRAGGRRVTRGSRAPRAALEARGRRADATAARVDFSDCDRSL